MPIIGWQGSFIFAAVPSFIIALLALKLKETPQFQIHQHIRRLTEAGQPEKARQVAKDYHLSMPIINVPACQPFFVAHHCAPHWYSAEP